MAWYEHLLGILAMVAVGILILIGRYYVSRSKPFIVNEEKKLADLSTWH